jgi:hypothetical protein
MRGIIKWAALILAGVSLAACHRGLKEGPYPALSVPQAAAEERETVVILDGSIAGKIAVEKQALRRNAQGRLEVFANIRNRTHYDQAVDVQTVFKNETWISTGDESAWTRLTLSPSETRSYREISLNEEPVNYTIRIRQGR